MMIPTSDNPQPETRLHSLVESAIKEVFNYRGEIISFGGDGFGAIFEEDRYHTGVGPSFAAQSAISAAQSLRTWWARQCEHKHQLRIGIHWGSVSIVGQPTVLRGQALGLDLVQSFRICDHYKEEAEAAVGGFFCVATEAVYGKLDFVTQKNFTQLPILHKYGQSINQSNHTT